MSAGAMTADASLRDIRAGRLFAASQLAIATSAARFVAIAAIMDALKEHFVLNNQEVGWINGAGLWGFTVTILIFGSLCDVLGMRLVLRLAVLAHVIGALLMIVATGFLALFAGSLLLSMADGLVQAACNPLVATLYADRKTEMFNKLHLWFPAGIVIFGLTVFVLNTAGADWWQAKLALILLPAAGYGLLFLGQRFPPTERVQSGVSFGAMFRETFCRPLFLLLAVCMMMTASLELGTTSWVTAILESAGIPGILVLVWISLLMAGMRLGAGPVVRRLAPTGILLCSAVLGGLGLFWLSFAQTLWMALAAGTVFAVGVSYFWPTMIGVTSERVPKGGPVALAAMAAVGMLSVGLAASPMIGGIVDRNVTGKLPLDKTTACLEQVVATYPGLTAGADQPAAGDVKLAVDAARKVLDQAHTGALPEFHTASALRAAIAAAPKSEAAAAAKSLLGPAENYGGRIAFRWMALLAVALTVIFAALFLSDLARGGYKVEKI